MQSIRLTRKRAAYIKQYFYSFYATNSSPKIEEQTWDTSIAQAEKVVGYPTSFLNLRWLLSDEFANAALHLRKLVGTNHPLLDVAKDLILNNEKPSWGLIILLLSKAGGHNKQFSPIDKDMTAGVLHSQRILAEVTEMIRISNSLHKGLITVDDNASNVINMRFGNKIALLCGDYLLSSSYNQLANLKNYHLNELMSTALRDLVECEFIQPRNKQNIPLPCKPKLDREDIEIPEVLSLEPLNAKHALGNAREEWIFRSILGGGSLLGKSCQGVLMLAGYEKSFQEHGYVFGKNLALTLQITKEYKSVFNDKYLSPVSAPVLFHLRRFPCFYSEFEHLIDEDGDINQVKIKAILQNSESLNDTKLMQKELCERTLSVLNHFHNCDAKNSLQNIILSIKL